MAESGCHLNGGTLEKHLRQLSDEKRRAYVMRHKNSIHEKIAEAARNGNKPLLKLLLDQFSPVERSKILRKQCKNGKLPIHHCLCAETDNHMESLKYLLSCVPKTQLYDLLTTFSSMFYNALHMAATYHNARAATILIAALPSERRFNFISQVAGQNKRTVLEFDIKEEFRTKVQQFLLPETPESHEIFSSSPSSDISADNYISWPATLEGPEVVLGYCEECHPHRHTEVNRRRRAKGQRQVPMHPRMTCDDASRLLFVDCVSALLHIDKFLEFVRLSKSIKMLLDCKNVRGLTILHIVAKDDRVDIMEKIFSAIHSFSNEMKWNLLTSTSRSGKTPLHYAAQYNRFNALKLLLFHAKDRDIELCQTHDGAGHDAMYYAGKDVRCFLEYVETHYWHTFSKPPTVLIFYNTFKGEPEWERGWAEDEKDHVVEGFKTHGIQPYTYPDFDGCMIIKEVRKIQNADEPISAMIVLVMSHGEEGIVFDKNKKQLPINALQHALDTSELKCVPKVRTLFWKHTSYETYYKSTIIAIF